MEGGWLDGACGSVGELGANEMTLTRISVGELGTTDAMLPLHIDPADGERTEGLDVFKS